MSDVTKAQMMLAPIAADRRARGPLVTDEHVDRAAALLVGLWAVAGSHGVTPDQWGYRSDLSRGAFDGIDAAIRKEWGWSVHTKHRRPMSRGGWPHVVLRAERGVPWRLRPRLARG